MNTNHESGDCDECSAQRLTVRENLTTEFIEWL
jgi:hypothetical protein